MASVARFVVGGLKKCAPALRSSGQAGVPVPLGGEEVGGRYAGEDGGTRAHDMNAAVQCDTRAGLRPAFTDFCTAVICCMDGIFCSVGICWLGLEG
jgi:hypothetical protein